MVQNDPMTSNFSEHKTKKVKKNLRHNFENHLIFQIFATTFPKHHPKPQGPSTQKVNMPRFSTYHGVTKMGFDKILSVHPTKISDFFNFMN